MEILPDTRVELTDAKAGERNCYLTTYGRVTGQPHEIEIWFSVDPDRRDVIYLLSGGRDRSDWVRNIRQNPDTRVRIAGAVYRGVARWVDERSAEDAHAREVVTLKYGERTDDGGLSEWGRTSLPVAIELRERVTGDE